MTAYGRPRVPGKVDAAAGEQLGPPRPASLVEGWWAGSLSTADAAAVSSWPGLNGSLTLTQGTASFQPVMDVDGVGGKPGVAFDGSNDFLGCGAVTTATSGCVVAVVHLVDTNPNTKGLWTTHASTVNEDYLIGRLGYNTADRIALQSKLGTAPAENAVKGGTALPDGACVLEWASSGTAWSLRINNTAETLTVFGTGANTGDWFGDSASRDTFTLGCERFRASGTTYTIGHLSVRVAYLGVYSAPLSSVERSDLYSWANGVYGITVA